MAPAANPFQRRLQERRDHRAQMPSGTKETRAMRALTAASYLAQVAVVVVAIFGYFYTVLPVYQKERLAEQVAEYDGIIKKQAPRVAELELRIAALQREREQLSQVLQKEREQLSSELRTIQRELASA